MNRKLAAAAVALVATAPLVAQVARPLPAPVPPVARPLPAPAPPVTRPRPTPDYQRPTPLPAPVPEWDNNHVHGSGRYFAGTTRCESQNFRPRTCRARTDNRVEIVQVHGGSCTRNRSFRYDANSITVTDGCRATFAYGYGNVRPKADSGSSALPWLLAGAGATAGIVAIANSGNDKQQQPIPAPPPPPPPSEPVAPPPPPASSVPQPPFPALPPAQLDANIGFLTADQQRTMQVCLFEGARQVGLSGGTVARFIAMEDIQQGNGGWRFRFRAEGTWPNGTRPFSVFCRATPTQIIEFTAAPTGPVTPAGG